MGNILMVQYLLKKAHILPDEDIQGMLFSEISPSAYKIGVFKNKAQRYIGDILDRNIYSHYKHPDDLPVLVYQHSSLIRRTLGDVDSKLQENKATNLAIAAPRLDGIVIGPSETFSFWQLVGMCTAVKGYLPGLMIKGGDVDEGIGGGMCQMTNLIHWMILHSPMTITEHHHHGTVDMFPDDRRQIPFGTGTSIMHNYKDYRFTNHTHTSFQLRIQVDGAYLVGELRASEALPYAYHVKEENAFFSHYDDAFYRNNEIYRHTIDKGSGRTIEKECIIKNCARVLYNESHIPVEMIR